MKKTRHRLYVLIGLTLIAAGMVFIAEDIEPLQNDKIYSFPYKVDKWTASDIPMEPYIYESLETPYAILRNYVSVEGDIINFAMVWYDDRQIAFHSASACLGGLGDRVKEDLSYTMKVNGGSQYQIGQIVTEKYGEKNLVLYYYMSDGMITGNQIKLRMHVIQRKLKMRRKGAVFVRIMTRVGTDEESTRTKLEEFMKLTLPLVAEYSEVK